ncbi:1835_t:CDS:2 [Rhizophagus irregularis]|nr:1835_t:CDS:2 [Rhizophagus irregularis]
MDGAFTPNGFRLKGASGSILLELSLVEYNGAPEHPRWSEAEYLSETRPKVLIELLQKKQVLKLLFDLGTSFG